MTQAVRPYLALPQFSIPNWAEGMAGAQLGRVHLFFTLCWTRLPREAEGGAGRGDGDVAVALRGLPLPPLLSSFSSSIWVTRQCLAARQHARGTHPLISHSLPRIITYI